MKKRVYINAATAISPDGMIGEGGILHAIEPDYKDVITNANLRRRMSHIVKMGVACGLLCLQKNNNKPVDSIITATGLGCLEDTEKFLNLIIENDERLLNPTAFTQSTFNVIGSQIALLTNNHAYNNTFVHRGISFESALIDAMMRINEGDKNVLVGAIDEVTHTAQAIIEKLGCLKNTTLGEGAHFFILSDKPSNTYIELKGVKALSGKMNSAEISSYIQALLKSVGIETSNIDAIITGENGNIEQDKIYTDVVNSISNSATHHTFKDACGEYHTASSHAFYIAVDSLITNAEIQNILIYNHYNGENHSIMLLGK